MSKSKSIDLMLIFFAFSLFMVMSMKGNLSFTWDLPDSLLYGFGIIVPIVYMVMYPLKSQQFNKDKGIIIIVAITYLYFAVLYYSFFNFLVQLSIIVSIISIIRLPIDMKEKVLSLIKTFLSICVGLSIVAWLLYLRGYPMGYEYVQFDDFHELLRYRFFNVSVNSANALFPRFSGMFLEPGQMAEPCALLLMADGGKLKGWRNIFLLIGIILSFSLAGYVLVALWYAYRSIKKGWVLAIVYIGLIGGFVAVSSGGEGSDNPISALVLSRLEYDADKVIAGNNRVNDYAHDKFLAMMKSSDCVFGIGKTIKPGDNWTYNISGYEKFIIYYGLVGFALVLLMIYKCYRSNKCRDTLVYMLIAILAFLPRNLLHSPMWIFPVILGFYILKRQSDKKESQFY